MFNKTNKQHISKYILPVVTSRIDSNRQSKTRIASQGNSPKQQIEER